MPSESVERASLFNIRRRRIFGGALFVVGAIVLGTFSPPYQEAEAAGSYYLLYCRGGAGTNTSLKPRGTSQRTLKLWLTFERGTQSATVNSVLHLERIAPGTCAWRDRGMSASERPRLTPDTEGHAPADVQYAAELKACSTDPNCVMAVRARSISYAMEIGVSRGTTFYRTP